MRRVVNLVAAVLSGVGVSVRADLCGGETSSAGHRCGERGGFQHKFAHGLGLDAQQVGCLGAGDCGGFEHGAQRTVDHQFRGQFLVGGGRGQSGADRGAQVGGFERLHGVGPPVF